MDLTPQLLHDVEFREAKRGYNTQDVDEFLERLAVGLERQEAAVREARQRIDAAEARAAEAERRAVQAEQAAGDSSASDETIKRTLVLAQRTADAAIREAEEEATRTLVAARSEADRLLADAHEASARAQADAEAEARQAHEQARARVLSEMHELEATRDRLRHDVDVLERHLDEQRARVRIAVVELQRMLDDPGSLYEVDLPVVSDAVAPSEAQHLPHADAATGWEPDAADEAWPAAADAEEEEAAADLEVEGPPTQPVDVLAERDADDDAYLSELRKAMTDDTPLGPRDEGDDASLFDSGAEVERSRFGRRR